LSKPIELAGELAALDGPAVAIVGARAATRGALEFARELAERLARAGQTVVSGGALGVDGAAHEGALAARGRTIAVLGTGVDVAYPERHAGLFARIRADGLLLSPFASGTPARPGHFPTRNPLIAALADSVVVVEASLRSGSLGTAEAALRLGLPLYCRPGSRGCDDLLLRGHARIAPAVADLAACLLGAPGALALPEGGPERGDEQQGRVLAALTVAGDAEALALRTGLPIGIVLEALIELELLGHVVRRGGARYLAIGGPAGIKG